MIDDRGMMGFDSAEIFNSAVERLRSQIWVGLLLFTLAALFSTRLARYLAGVQSTTIAVIIQVTLYAVIIAGLLLRKSRHATLIQTLFLISIHLTLPFVIVLYGGNQGFGDLMLFQCALISILYGWRRWMYATFAISSFAFLYALYLDLIGQPLTPFLSNTSRFATLKITFFIGFAFFVLYMAQRFYQRILDRYQSVTDEQLQLTEKLQQDTSDLNQLSTKLQLSREQIVLAREEERRQLRHDLQEHIGPTLASLGYRAGAARNALHRQPDDAVAELNELEGNIKQTLNDVRRFVYALHPPMLDQLGLLGAIKEHVRKVDAPFKIALSLPDQLEDVSASAEISIFRLLQTVLDLAKEFNTTSQVTVELRAESARLHLDLMLDYLATRETLNNAPQLQLVSERFNELGGEIVYADGNSAELIAVQIRGNVPI